MDLQWPRSAGELANIQKTRRRQAFERAKKAPFYRGKLESIDADRLDDPSVWAKIPLTTKEELRSIAPGQFHEQFCVRPQSAAVEYWRSGGSTGRPLFYPRSAQDSENSLLSFCRGLAVAGASADDLLQVSFPLGVHPVGHLYARAATQMGAGSIWCGGGSNTPSEAQLQIIAELKPTIWAGMASYGLHLANLAEASGFDLAASSVKKIIVAAEPLSRAKRQKLERMWGAEVYDQFGMSEGALMACEGTDRDGMHIWADQYFCEVVDERTGEPVSEGQVGVLAQTPLSNNEMTPFLRWNSGDIVSMHEALSETPSPWSLFPILKHERRTVDFFKVRGININHPELEDLVFFEPRISEFRAEVYNDEKGLDVLHLLIEAKRGIPDAEANEVIKTLVSKTFHVTPRITVQPAGTIARQFEANIKAPRFTDLRG